VTLVLKFSTAGRANNMTIITLQGIANQKKIIKLDFEQFVRIK